MLPRVYVETTFVSYLTARPSRDRQGARAISKAHTNGGINLGRITSFARRNWSFRKQELAILKRLEERLVILKAMISLDTTEEAIILAEELVRSRSLPEKAADDALHIAFAAQQKIPYLLTWNCRHMANATMRPAIEAVCTSKGYKVPIICTAEELKKVIS